MNRNESIAAWTAHRDAFAAKGLVLPGVRMYVPDEWKNGNLSIQQVMAMDAATGPMMTDPNSSIPALLTTAVDPEVIRIVFAPLEFAEILGERKAGDWLEDTRVFPVIEQTGEVSSYGDYNNNGRAGINFNYPQFQSYLYQCIINYGEREAARAGLLKINYVSELNLAAADLLNRFGNLSYAYGISGLQNYGIINNPYLAAYVSPALKAWGGITWFDGNAPAATANEVYNDIVALVEKLILQGNGTIDQKSEMILAMSPQSSVALTFTNSFGVNVNDLLKKNFPNMKVVTAPQYGTQGATNAQGYSTAGNAMQLIVRKIQGQNVTYAAFNEKMRAHKLVPELSSWKQKFTSGVWGTILRIPMGVVGMIGI
jgi:hypothetical protein